MQTSARPADVLFFRCAPCGTELSVPLALQGIEGPCPHCGHQIKAPLCPPPPVHQMVHLPPLDRRHETMEVPVPAGPALDWRNPAVVPDPSLNFSKPAPGPPFPSATEQAGVPPKLLPRRLSSHPAQGFQAKLAISPPEEISGSPRLTRPSDPSAANSSPLKRERVLAGLFESRFFRVFRVALLVTTGGLCAGLVLYLKDRNWVLDLPWRPAPVETVVELPAAVRSLAPLPAEPANPFLGEDPSELDDPSGSASAAPLPEASAIPVAASPIAVQKK